MRYSSQTEELAKLKGERERVEKAKRATKREETESLERAALRVFSTGTKLHLILSLSQISRF